MLSLDPASENQNPIVCFNGRFIPLADAKISLLTHALHYGTGVFEGIRGYWCERQHELFLLRVEDHYRRWKQNCGILRMHLPFSPEALRDLTLELIRHNQFHTDLYIRPLAFHSCAKIGVHPDGDFTFALIAVPYGVYLDSRHGLHAGVVAWRRIEDAAIPARAKICGTYVNSVLAGDEARRNGFDEAIFLTESGHVAEGATSNIFIVRDRKLITPPPSDNILEGITRDCVMKLARNELHLEVVERSIDRSELYIADEIFFTGTAVEMAPVVQVDHRLVANGLVGPVTRQLRDLYYDASHGRMDAYRAWLEPVYQPVMALAH